MTPQSDEDEVWRQIVASFNETAEDASAEQPWPDRENVTEQADAGDGDDARGGGAPGGVALGDDALGDGVGDDDRTGEERAPTPGDDDHYIPPPPPPLPHGDALSRLSWLALFGGPAYLLLAALLQWPMDGWIVFAAVAAFIAGFVILVVRMGDGPPADSGWDDGAVV
ncbi:hypothetical protein SAMN05421833_101241 [Microbispora rosea]|uniref:DUF308 domain-containing protein n=1 Tax=Microbispora rosea TaxID=58117 RepID=A0A1N6R543_9ACTN|nr:hypothetical protein [Microbispora rosea]GIH45671.1 hypothetical protein Mro03_08500 [Microbispora rosea subsp. rosea]SIQ23968.1 hypothetical protein SAMN05421833_101241 [Microbispora rosea]